MIENHERFTYSGCVTHQDWVFYVFQEGIYAHHLNKPAATAELPGLGRTDSAAGQEKRALLAAWPGAGWLAGWHPAGEAITWGNAPATRVLARCELDMPPDIRWSGSHLDFFAGSMFNIHERYQPGDDMVFVWHVTPAPTRCVVIPRPMLAPGQPGFDPAFNEAAAHAVLARGVPAINRHWIEVRGADNYTLKGYQIEVPGDAPNLFFDGGVLIQTHAEATLKGFHPWPDAFCVTLPDDSGAIDAAVHLLNDPSCSRATLLRFHTTHAGDVPAGHCKVLVDKTEDGFSLVPLRGHVPLVLPDGRPNPAADPSITPHEGRVALATGTYALQVDPRRVTRPPRFDFGTHWEIDEIAAAAQAVYCNVTKTPIRWGIGHDYLMPMVEDFVTDPALNAYITDEETKERIEAALLPFHADRSMAERLLVRVDTARLIAFLAKHGVTVASTHAIDAHPEPFRHQEFRNAIVVTVDPPESAHLAGLEPSERDAMTMRCKQNLRRFHSFAPRFFGPNESMADNAALKTAFYFTPDGECLVPGSLGLRRNGVYNHRAHPLFDRGWGRVEVIQF